MSGYLDTWWAGFTAGVETGERMTRQFDIDSYQIALSRYERLHLGFQRIKEITALAEQVRAEYKPALQGGPEADVYQHHMDQEIQEIIKGNMELIPFEVRYPELKKQKYERRRKT